MSTVFLPRDYVAVFGQNTGMLKDILSRIELRLSELGLAESTAAKKAGLSADAIRNIRRSVESGDDRKGVSTNTLIALAPVLETTACWLLEGRPPEHAPAGRLYEVFMKASQLPDELQDRIIDFAEFEIERYERETET